MLFRSWLDSAVERAAELGIFRGESVGEPNPTGSGGEVLAVKFAGELDLRLEFGNDSLGEGDVAVFASLSFADDDLFAGEVKVFVRSRHASINRSPAP